MHAKTREALQSILSDIHPEDYFGIILFDNQIIPWKDFLTKATEENLAEAIQYVKGIKERGSRIASTWIHIKLPIDKYTKD